MDIEEFQFAGFWVRVVANFLDGVCATAIAVPVWLIIDVGLLHARSHPERAGAANLVSFLFILYNTIYLVGRTGQSWGRKFEAIKVVGYDGQPVGLMRTIVRAFIASTLSAWVFGLGFLWIIWDEKKQAWHDKIMKTYVIRVTEPAQ